MGVVRRTKSVQMLLDIFKQSTDAISTVDLVERLNSSMNKTTVYRILERLEEDGVLHSFVDKNGLTWYASCMGCSPKQHTDMHPHFQCRDCGKVVCLAMEISVPSIPRHRVDSAEILLVGQCADCL